jgi:asparagine synthase (glutamine-hydrolysing)
MCGIAGMIDLSGRRPVPEGCLEVMAYSLFHRGPDEDGFLCEPGLGLASRRLSIVGLADGRQPITNEDRSVAVVYNGELFDYPERRRELEGRGHQFRTGCDTEIIPHLWEDHQEGMFEYLRGQFALALWDGKRQRLVLARDRFGICPLYWTREDGWLLFASEIKALLATGLVRARPDRRGINHVFSFFAVPGPITCFAGVESLLPGHYLEIQRGGPEDEAVVREKIYWELDFPEHGKENPERDAKKLVDEFETVMVRSVEKRLRADVPVVSYLSGGVDSSIVVAMASKIRGEPLPTFTIGIDDPELDETSEADIVARHVGSKPVVVRCGAQDILRHYPRLVQSAEAPVVDTSCTALMMLAQQVNANGYKAALTGEGSDEWLAGYSWYKVSKLLGYLDVIPGVRLSQALRRAFLRLSGVPRFPWETMRRAEEVVGGPNPWLDVYGLMSISKLHFFGPALRDTMNRRIVFMDLGIDPDRVRRWHPLNRGLYVGARIQLPGLLLNAKGDRVAMRSSVETRYPFLDEDVFAFLARLHPRWKLRGFRDKYILRLLAERWLPKSIAWRPKLMFRAPWDSIHLEPAPAFVDQLLSPESLRRTGYFDVEAVQHWRQRFRKLRRRSAARVSAELGLVGVFSTQLWHHTFIESGLADLPSLVDEIPVGGEARRRALAARQPAASPQLI